LTSDTQSDISGQIKCHWNSERDEWQRRSSFGPGKLAGEPLESAGAATFNGPNVNIENVDVRLVAGHIVASGNFNTKSKRFDFQGKAENIQLARLTALANRPGFPSVTGVADFTAHVSGTF
jgi:autotransporter translocation and assembly factor TamB